MIWRAVRRAFAAVRVQTHSPTHQRQLQRDAARLAELGIFRPEDYIAANPEVAETGLDPFTHFMNHGMLAGLNPGGLPLDFLAAEPLIERSPLFDAGWYRATSVEAKRSALPPARHYLWIGAQLGYDPSPSFDTAAYAAYFRDVGESNMPAFVHYLLYGRTEGRWAIPHRQQFLRTIFPSSPIDTEARQRTTLRTSCRIDLQPVEDMHLYFLPRPGASPGGGGPAALAHAFNTCAARRLVPTDDLRRADLVVIGNPEMEMLEEGTAGEPGAFVVVDATANSTEYCTGSRVPKLLRAQADLILTDAMLQRAGFTPPTRRTDPPGPAEIGAALAELVPLLRRSERTCAPRILFVSHNLETDEGAPRSLMELVTGLKRMGAVQPLLFSLKDGGLDAAYAAAGVEVIVRDVEAPAVAPSTDCGDSGCANKQEDAFPHSAVGRDFVALLRRRQIDAVVANTTLSAWLLVLARREGLPTLAILREEAESFLSFTCGPRPIMDLCREGVTGADLCVFVAEHTRARWTARHRLPRTRVIHNGGPSGQPAGADTGVALRAHLGLPRDALLLVSVGVISPRKAQGDILDAVLQLPDDLRARTHLLFLGDTGSPYATELRARIDAMPQGDAARIHLLPSAPDPSAVYAAADIFVLASHSESYPRVIREAMQAGLPIVASAVAGVREQVVDGHSALLFPPCDIEALRGHLARLLTEPELRTHLARNARQLSDSLPSQQEMLLRYHAALSEVLLRHRMRGATSGTHAPEADTCHQGSARCYAQVGFEGRGRPSRKP